MSSLQFVKPKPPPLRAPWEKTVVYLPMGMWVWKINTEQYGEQRVHLVTVPQLNLMVFWNKVCKMDVVYLKENGVMQFRTMTDTTELYRRLTELMRNGNIPDYGFQQLPSCEIKAVTYQLTQTKRIIVNPKYLAFKDQEGFIAVYYEIGKKTIQ